MDPSDLQEVDMGALRTIGVLATRRTELELELSAAVLDARDAGHSWAQIGMMLGVSKQAAQQKYGGDGTARQQSASAEGGRRATPTDPRPRN